jgi:hypothetical protein
MANAAETLVGASGSVYVASVGATEPSSPTATPSSDWTELGYLSEDGVTWSVGKATEDVNAWQSFFPVRTLVTSQTSTLAMTLRQWNESTLVLALGGGTVTEELAGFYKYEPPAPGTVDERAIIVDWNDGDRHYRLIVRRAVVSDAVETQLQRGAAADLPVTFNVLGNQSGEAPFILLTDDDAFSA